tara:strand:+ start:496 stop:1077 length:582 start_codon:yes stop_codon:yes gene_type:complete
MSLFLDKNFLYSWDQFFLITSQISNLRTLALSGNKLRKIDKNYFEGKNIDAMVPLHLKELVLIDMSLDWSQIDILSPAFVYVEELFLVRNNCNVISSKYKIDPNTWKNLRMLNLEQNGITDWEELAEFRVLKDFNRLIINKNLIKTITQKSGFNSLEYISIEDNLIADWKSFDQLNEFGQAVAGQFGQAKKIK